MMRNASPLLVLAGLATSVVAEPIPRTAHHAMRTAAPTAAVARRQEGVPEDCTFFDIPTSEDQDCEYFAGLWGIPVEDFIAWNPSVGDDCSGIKVGEEYCVERNWGVPPEPTTTGDGPSPTGTVPSPVQEGIIDTCTGYYKAVSGDDCSKIVAKFGSFDFADFLAWNPAVGETCSDLWLGYYYCVATPDQPTGTSPGGPSPTTTSGPSPTQDGLTKECKAFHKAVSGDNCAAIVDQYGSFSFEDFLKWNPAVGEACNDLWLGYYYCVGVDGTPPSPTAKPTPTTTSGPPTQTGVVGNCQRWHKAVSGDTCAGIVNKYGTFTLAEFLKWNPAVGETCSDLWLGYNYCIGIPGTPTEPPKPTTTACPNVPTPTQPGSICACKRWHKVASGNHCETIQKQYGITAAQFQKWNPEVGASCGNLWLGYNVCVSA